MKLPETELIEYSTPPPTIPHDEKPDSTPVINSGMYVCYLESCIKAYDGTKGWRRKKAISSAELIEIKTNIEALKDPRTLNNPGELGKLSKALRQGYTEEMICILATIEHVKKIKHTRFLDEETKDSPLAVKPSSLPIPANILADLAVEIKSFQYITRLTNEAGCQLRSIRPNTATHYVLEKLDFEIFRVVFGKNRNRDFLRHSFYISFYMIMKNLKKSKALFDRNLKIFFTYLFTPRNNVMNCMMVQNIRAIFINSKWSEKNNLEEGCQYFHLFFAALPSSDSKCKFWTKELASKDNEATSIIAKFRQSIINSAGKNFNISPLVKCNTTTVTSLPTPPF